MLVASPKVVEGQGNLADLARYAAFRNGNVTQTEARFAFDLVCLTRLEERRAYLEKRVKSDDQYGEVRFEELLLCALRSRGLFNRFAYVRNYPLRLFVGNMERLDARERNFVSSSAHADFLLYRKNDCAAVFVVEVNGAQHATETKTRRDALKRSILDKAGIAHDAVPPTRRSMSWRGHVGAILDRLYALDGARIHAANVISGPTG